MRLAKENVSDLRRQEKEITDQIPVAYQEYHEELCSFLSIDPGAKLARGWAEGILDFAEEEGVDPKMFASRLVATIENTQRFIDEQDSKDFSALRRDYGALGDSEWHYLQMVILMRKRSPSMLLEEEAYQLRKAVISSEISTTLALKPTNENRCQEAVYHFIERELSRLESFWWVVVGEPK